MSNYIVKKIYNPKNIEEEIYKSWEQSNYFAPHTNTNKENYCIMMPPPNITGQLHLGHAFQHTIIDSLIRYQRMQGKNTLWQTGIDHAGIATQILIEQNTYNNHMHNTINNHHTQDTLIKQAWNWKKHSENIINYQMKRLGNSIDWTRKRFTMDSNMSYSVKEAFIKLYQDNLIYKNTKLVNWDTQLQTAISDLEVSNKKIKGTMWYIRYPLDTKNFNNINNLHYLVIATTRPETILGDIAIAIHPKDSRYNILNNQHVITPITNRRIPIIFDEHVDITKGTGCVKITPAHDFNDYIIGKKHNLPIIKIFSLTGKILKKPEIFNFNNNTEKTNSTLHYKIPQIFHGLNAIQARTKIISECNKLNLLDSIKPHNITITYNSRTNHIIEPMLTNQWYIRTKKLAQPAIDVVKKNIITFIPEQYKNMYFSWMNNVEDWCISRQIWWGHKIPAWYDNNNAIYVGHCEKDIRTKNQLNNEKILHEDTDVLDTWFSSSLWTFSTLGWPKNHNMLNIFHPTNVIVSGFDIIFFWIARMIMLSMYFIKDVSGKSQIPFKTVYITGLIRDEFGQKMSKSKGNTIDPIDIIDGISTENLLKKRIKNIHNPKLIKKITKYTTKQFPNGIKPNGSDALRFTLSALASSGRDIHWDIQRLTGYRNFCNKLWNASRFILNNTKNQDCGIYTKHKLFSTADRWIITEYHQTIHNVHQAFEKYRFDKVANILYEFIWHQFCDWYIELTKPIFIGHTNPLKLRATRYTLITLLESLLRLAHPIIPFITEKIWQEIKNITGKNGNTIMLQPFPEYNKSAIDTKSVINLKWIKKIITSIRTIRTNMHIKYATPLHIIFKNASLNITQCIMDNHAVLSHIAQLKKIDFIQNNKKYPKSISILLEETELLILIPDTFDKNIEMNQLNKKLELINYKIKTITNILNNQNFNKNAKKYAISKKQEQLNYFKKIRNTLMNQYSMIQSL